MTHSHKHHSVLLGGDDTFCSLMFMSVKLVIERHKPIHLARELPLGVTPNHMANVIECNRETTRTLKKNLKKEIYKI